MTSRDTALFNTPRTSHFGLLMSDDEASDSGSSTSKEQTAESIRKSENSATVDGTIRATDEKTVHPMTNGKSASSTEEDAGDWACARAKVHHKKQPPVTGGGSRNVGFTRGGTTGVGFLSHQHPHGHHGHGHHHQGPRKVVAPVSLEQLNAEQTLEIYDFPEAWRTSDIRKAFSVFEGQYRLKWQNDTSCFIHFETAEMASKALAEVHPEGALIRPYAPENVIPASSKPEAGLMTTENTLEIYSFPSTWHSAELNKLLAAFSGQYRLKWRNDASCYAVFDSTETMQKALLEISNESACKVRQYVSLPVDQGHGHLVQP